jgi:penicillin-binding protein 2
MRNRVDSHRSWVVRLVIGGIGVLYVGRLGYLQLSNLQAREKAQFNTIRRVEVVPPRGIIRDRHGRLWVHNKPFFHILVTPRQISGLDTSQVAKVLDLSPEVIRTRLVQAVAYNPTKASLFSRYVPLEKFLAFSEQSWRLTGFSPALVYSRAYNYPVGAPFLGYLGEVTQTEIDASEGLYTLGNLIGRSGLERWYEPLLRGKKGYRFIVVDAMGREISPYKEGSLDIPPIPGQDLLITVDAALQQFAESLFYGKAGALVAMEPKTGEILCAVSAPTYDPNLFSGESFDKNWQKLQADSTLPLYNRFLQGMYPPGSTFKLLNALIALQESTITPQTVYGCVGGFPRGIGKPGCHSHPAPLELIGAIQHSCNAYFAAVYVDFLMHPRFRTIQEAYDTWRDYMLYCGVGRRLGVDIPSEKPGFLPTSRYYNKIYKNRWNAFTTISNSIGQGEVLMTPLQMANIMCLIANRGYYIQPHFFKGVSGQKTENLVHFDTIRVPIDSVHFETIIQGMRLAVEAGTGYTAYVPGLDLCGKTGTAQNPHGKDHSVFVGFAPWYDPKIAVAVIVENAGWGATWAAPIASLVAEKYLKGTISRPQLYEYICRTPLLPAFMSHAP